MTLQEAATIIHNSAQHDADACGLHCVTIFADDSGAFEVRAPVMNKSILVGVLTRALLKTSLAVESEGPVDVFMWAKEKQAFADGQPIEFRQRLRNGFWSEWREIMTEPLWHTNWNTEYRLKGGDNAAPR